MAKSILELIGRLVKAGYPENTAKKIATGELPMDDYSRVIRAADQEVDVDRHLIHRSPISGILEFEASQSGRMGPGVYTTPRPQYGKGFGDVQYDLVARNVPATNRQRLELLQEYSRKLIDQGVDPRVAYRQAQVEANRTLMNQGYTTIEMPNRIGGVNEVLVLDKANLRDPFRAAFDPDNIGKPNILGGAAPVAAGGILGALGATGSGQAEASTADMNKIMARRMNAEPFRLPEEFWTQGNGIGVAQAPAQNPVSQGAEYVAGKLHSGARNLENAGILSLLSAPLSSLGDIASRAAYGESKVTDPAEALLSASAFVPQLYMGGKAMNAMRDKDIQSMLFRELFGD